MTAESPTFEEIKAKHEADATLPERVHLSGTWELRQQRAALIEMVEAQRALAHPHPTTMNQMPLVCFFANEEDREDFKQIILAAKPNMRAVKVP